MKNTIITIIALTLVIVGACVYVVNKDTLVGSVAGPDVYSDFRVHGVLMEGSKIITVSTTSAAYTLTGAELMSGKVISIANTAGAAALALTLPASSTFQGIPNSGDTITWGIQNLHDAAATTTTITAGAGIDLQGDTANDDIINGGVTGSLTCWRQASTDIVCQISEKVSAE